MANSKKKTNKGLLTLLVATLVVMVLYAGACIAFGAIVPEAMDPELTDFGAVFSYHVRGVGELLSFSYGDGSNLYFALSAFLYALSLCFIVFLVAAFLTYERTKRKIVWWAVIDAILDIAVYAIIASGMVKYMQIIAGEGVFADKTLLLAFTWAILILGAIHFLLSVLSYFWSISESYNETGGSNGEEETEEESSNEYVEESDSSEGTKTEKKMIRKRRPYVVQNFYD